MAYYHPDRIGAAAIALLVKAIVIPVVLHRIIVRLGIHRNIETVVGIGYRFTGCQSRPHTGNNADQG